MTTGPGDGDAGTGPPKIARILDAIADAFWSARVTFRLLRDRWS